MDVLSRCACGGAPALYAPDVKSETKYAASVVCHHCGVSMQMANHDSDPKRVVAAWNRAHPHRINTMTVNEKGLEAAQVAAREGCGLFIESQHVFCDDPVVGEAADGYGKPLRQPYCSCKGDAERIIKAYLRASSNDAEPRDLEKPMLVFQYRNWRNEVAERHVIPQRVWWGSTEWHPHGCWLLSAYDLDRQAIRDFDIRGINAPELFGKIEATHPSTGGEGGVHKLLNDIYDFLGGVDGAVELRARILSAIEPVAASPGVGDGDEAYELGKRDGYEEAVQEIDVATGGDGEYRYCTDHDPERHCPDAATMKARIIERFDAPTSPAPSPAGGDVREAVLSCPHTITADEIVLRRSDKHDGNALFQLSERIRRALSSKQRSGE